MSERLIPTAQSAVSSGEPYVAYFSDRDEEEGPTTSCGTEEASNRPDWMREMGPKFMDAKVGEVVWPGTHDSGAHCEEFDFSKVVDDHWLRYIGTHMLSCLGHSFKQFASDWSRTQSLSVRRQLDHGVRYIDLRLSKCVRDNEYYVVHSFCGPALRDVMNEIHDFFSEHQGECLLLEVTPVCEVDHVELHSMFERKLGKFLLKRERESHQISPISLTLSHLVEKGRIVLFYKLPAMHAQPENLLCFWDGRCIHAPFVMSLDLSVKESYQLEKFTDFSSRYHQATKHRHLFHFMYALTPTLSQILRSADVCKYLVSSDQRNRLCSLQECAQSINPKLGKFVERIKHHVVSEQCQDIGMIVSVDYVEESDLLNQVIAINVSKFRSSISL